MSETRILELPQWDLVAEQRPVRSILYAPAPEGLGTAMGESLTSYLARLAAAHCVYPGILLREMILPRLEEPEMLARHQNSIRCFDVTGTAHT